MICFLILITTHFLAAGLYFCFKKPTDANIFIILYGVTSIYFAGVMVCLLFILFIQFKLFI
jgi:dolichyl-diphosphooligosaccharide--protein glycosyltransferase